MQPVVLSLWENIILGLDFGVSSKCSKLALENFGKLYIRVRSFSHAKDIVSQYKLKAKQSKAKALRKQLQKQSEKKWYLLLIIFVQLYYVNNIYENLMQLSYVNKVLQYLSVLFSTHIYKITWIFYLIPRKYIK